MDDTLDLGTRWLWAEELDEYIGEHDDPLSVPHPPDSGAIDDAFASM
jgi:hypothetical protein